MYIKIEIKIFPAMEIYDVQKTFQLPGTLEIYGGRKEWRDKQIKVCSAR
jgi:hypothetical protein